MNGLDFFILVGLIAAAFWGWATGVAVQVAGGIGIAVGFWLGVTLAPLASARVHDASAKLAVTLATVVIVTTVFSSIGRRLGRRSAKALHRWRLGTLERALGVVAAVTLTLATFWVVAISLAGTPLVPLGLLINRSAVVQRLDAVLPAGPAVMARLGRLADPSGLPRVFAGLEPQFSAPVLDPEVDQVQTTARRAQAATVKIEGAACGSVFDGSGFVASPELVITNAHVVAGVRSPVVIDSAGRHPAIVVGFDPNVDIAVLRVRGLSTKPLALTSVDAQRGATGAVLGFPGGGPFTVGGAAVRNALPAVGRDIYGQHLTTRNIFELQATIRPGNSGGPFVLVDGEVGGVVFARSTSDDGIGYALAPSEVTPLLQQAIGQLTPISTGPCTHS